MSDLAQRSTPRHHTSSNESTRGDQQHLTAPARLAALGWQLERDGMVGHEADVAEIAHLAADVGVSPVLVGVLADGREPEVARIRAFGLVALGLSRRLQPPV